MKRALITGAAGQDGTYLTELLLLKGYEVWGVVGPEPGEYLAWAAAHEERLHVCDADLADAASLDRLIAEVVPDEVYNFAAISSVALSWEHPALVSDIDATGVARLLEVLRRRAPRARLCQATSAEIFGEAVESPQTEETPIRPVTPYGSAKAHAHFLVRNAREGWGMFACSAILYNHESPRRGYEFVTRKITRGAAQIKLGLAKDLRMGNLDAVRDWGFAGDYVEAEWRMLQQDQPNDYVIATGKGHTVRELCQLAFSRLGLNYQDYVVFDERFYKPPETVPLIGDASRAQQELGWTPQVTFEKMVEMMVDVDLAELQAKG